jgi:hypothetical protein
LTSIKSAEHAPIQARDQEGRNEGIRDKEKELSRAGSAFSFLLFPFAFCLLTYPFSWLGILPIPLLVIPPEVSSRYADKRFTD